MRPIRISKKLYNSLPDDVANALRGVVARHPNIKSLRIVNEPEGYKTYHGEGEEYTYYYDGQVMTLQMVSESTIGASGVRYEIGAQSPPLPAGTLVFRTWYAGVNGYQLTVHVVGDTKFLTA
jgi:hypothetical protein